MIIIIIIVIIIILNLSLDHSLKVCILDVSNKQLLSRIYVLAHILLTLSHYTISLYCPIHQIPMRSPYTPYPTPFPTHTLLSPNPSKPPHAYP